jgi:hypothetical protein
VLLEFKELSTTAKRFVRRCFGCICAEWWSVLSIGVVVIACFWGAFYFLSRNWVPLPQLAYLQDIGILFDAGWRFVQGQMPHRDYISPLGPAYAIYAGLPQSLFGVKYTSYGNVQTVCGIILSLTSYLLLFNRLNLWIAILYSLVVGIVGGGTYHIGGPPELTTLATVYNRHVWALLMVLTPVFFLKSTCPPRAPDLLLLTQGGIAGAIFAVLCFYKVNFFAGAVAVIIAGCILDLSPVKQGFWIGCGIGFACLSVVFLWIISGDISGMVRDLAFAASARKSGWLKDVLYFNPWRVALNNMVPLLFAAIFAGYAFMKWGWRHAAASAFVIALGFLLMTTNANASGFGIPLVVSAMLISAHKPLGVGQPRPSSESFLVWGAVGAIGFNLLIWPQFLSWKSWSQASDIIRSSDQPLSASGTSLEGLYDSSDNMWGPRFWPRVTEGRSLIRNSVNHGETVMYVDFTNIFNFAAEAASPKGTFLWVDPLSTFSTSRDCHPSPEHLFEDVDFIVFPKQPLVLEAVKGWLEVYEAHMNSLFFRIDETDNFYLLARILPRKRQPQSLQHNNEG